MLTKMKFAGVFLILISALGCDRTEGRPEAVDHEGSPAAEEEVSPEPMEVTLDVPEIVGTVAEVAVSIEEAPERAAEILAEHGMTRERLDSLVYEIAGKVSWTEAFLEAIGR